ncbi:MAG: hypothetical protein ACR2FM_00995 [Candidatus Saccharimonadales bacterium]
MDRPKIIQLVIDTPKIYGLGEDSLVYVYLPNHQQWTLLDKAIGLNA